MHGLSATLLLLTGLTALTTADKPLQDHQNTGGRWKRESLGKQLSTFLYFDQHGKTENIFVNINIII